MLCIFFFKQKTAYEMRISDWSSDVCSSDLLRAILEHVIKLPEQKLLELTALLEDVTLSNIIEASATVADRLTFVQGLEELIYNDDHSKDLLERAQLHQVVAQNIWLLGEQYNLTVSDKGLTHVLKKHRTEEHTSELQSLIHISYA